MECGFDTGNRDSTAEKVSKRKFRFGLLVWPALAVSVFVFIVSMTPEKNHSKPDFHRVVNILVKLFTPKTKPEPTNSPRHQIQAIESAIDTFLLNTGEYPVALNNLIVDPGLQGWGGPYLKEIQLSDKWSRPFIYISSGRTDGGPLVISYGADGKPGGKGEDADVDNDEKGKQK